MILPAATSVPIAAGSLGVTFGAVNGAAELLRPGRGGVALNSYDQFSHIGAAIAR